MYSYNAPIKIVGKKPTSEDNKFIASECVSMHALGGGVNFRFSHVINSVFSLNGRQCHLLRLHKPGSQRLR